MNDVIKTVFDANLSTLLIVASLAFLFIAVAGSVAGKIDPGKAGRIGSGITGAVLLVLGIVLKGPAPQSTPTPSSASVELAAPGSAQAAVAPVPQPAPEQPPLEAMRLTPVEPPAQAQLLDDARRRIEQAGEARTRGARFFGTLLYTDGSQRLPLGGARIELRTPGARAATYTTTSDRDGVYAFPAVRPGTYEVAVRQGDTALTVLAPPRPVSVPERATGRRLTITVQR